MMLFMKGNKMFPQCGFSNTAVTILKSIVPAEDFETFDVLSDEEVSNVLGRRGCHRSTPNRV